jgi:DNA-binding GntR family transcriptional regulator
MYEYRKLLECFTAGRAAKETTTAEVARLKAIIDVENQPGVDMQGFLRANEEFHLCPGGSGAKPAASTTT